MKPLYSVLFVLFFLFSTILMGQTLTYGEVNDFEVGDIFHYKKTDKDGPEDPIGPPYYIEQEIIGKFYSANGDTVFYIKKWKKVRVPFCATCAVERTNGIDTVANKNLNVVISGGPPPIWDTNNCMSNWTVYTGNYLLSPTTHCDSLTVRKKFEWADSCKYDFPYYFDYTLYEFTKGLGVTYFKYNHCGTSLTDCNYYLELVYYKKGQTTCGTPVGLLNSVTTLNPESDLRIFPNPFSQEFTIESDRINITQVVIYDLLGNEILQKQSIGSSFQFSLLDMESGIYVISVTFENGIQTFHRIVKR